MRISKYAEVVWFFYLYFYKKNKITLAYFEICEITLCAFPNFAILPKKNYLGVFRNTPNSLLRRENTRLQAACGACFKGNLIFFWYKSIKLPRRISKYAEVIMEFQKVIFSFKMDFYQNPGILVICRKMQVTLPRRISKYAEVIFGSRFS